MIKARSVTAAVFVTHKHVGTSSPGCASGTSRCIPISHAPKPVFFACSAIIIKLSRQAKHCGVSVALKTAEL